MIYRYVHNISRIEAIIDKFDEFVAEKTKYSSPKAFITAREGYKAGTYVKASDILDTKHWKKSMINSGEIAARFKKVMQFNENNFVFKSQKISFCEALDKDPVETGTVLYLFFTGNDDAANLEELVKCFGRRYDTLSYLFFLKDPDTYFPCRPSIFRKAFELLEMDTEGFDGFTYEHYSAYNDSIKELALVYSNYAGHINSLDAHSFAWIICRYEPVKTYIFNEQEDITADTEMKHEGSARRSVRLHQTEFRRNVVEYWNGRCAVTECAQTEILEASHIKSYSDCKTRNECVTPDNGLLLTPNLHTLFDHGMISFTADGRIMISDRLTQHDRDLLGINESMRLRITAEGREKYLKYHRENVFR